MRIAILSPFPPYKGGIAQFSQQLMYTLSNKNIVKAFSFSRLYPKMLFPCKSQFTGDMKNCFIEYILDTIQPISYYKTAKKIQQFYPDALLIAYWMPFLIPSFSTITKVLKNKTIIIFLLHNAISHEAFKFEKLLITRLFNKVNGFILMSNHVKNDLLCLVPKAIYSQHYHPIYLHFHKKIDTFVARKILKLPTSKKTLLFFGFIRPYKGLDVLLEAFSLLDSSYQLLIAGECCGSFDAYQEQINLSLLKDSIKIENRYIPNSDVHIFFSAVDLLILPYKTSTQSGVVAIAYYFDLPVLATDTGNFKELLEVSGTGLISEINANSLANKIRIFFSCENSSFVYAIQNEKHKFSWGSFSDKTIDLVTYLKTKN